MAATKKRLHPGRGGYYRQELDAIAQELVGKLGARNQDLAEFFEVDVTTIEYWCKNFESFALAVKKGRLEAGLKVSQALFQRAVGYSHKDTQMFFDQKRGRIVEKEYIKHYPPDVAACKNYLSIMFRETWAENSSININHNHSGTINHRKIEEIPLHELSQEQQALLFELNMKQLTVVADSQKN